MENKSVKLVLSIATVLILGVFTSQAQEDRQERKERPTAEELIKKMDKDEDGKLSKKEVKGPLEKDFDKIDTDEDGFLTKEELEKAPKPERGQGRRERN